MPTNAERLYNLTITMLSSYQKEINNSHTDTVTRAFLRNQITKIKIESCLKLADLDFGDPAASLAYIEQILKWEG